MLMVILGAGASHGAGRSGGARLPLAKDLFDPGDRSVREANALYPAATPIVARVRRAQEIGGEDTDVEAELEAIFELGARQPDVREELIAMRFWLRHRISQAQGRVEHDEAHVTRYADLVNDLGDWAAEHEQTVVFVTFNYDTLLDRALSAHSPAMHRVLAEGSPVPPQGADKWAIFRPHGSIDWTVMWEIDTWVGVHTRTAGQLLAQEALNGGNYSYSEGEDSWRISGAAGWARAPAISVPLLNKSEFAFPIQHRPALGEAITSTTHVLTIGWRGREKHFLGLLTGLPAETPIVSTDLTEEGAKNISMEIAAATNRRVVGFARASMESLTEDPDTLPLPGRAGNWWRMEQSGGGFSPPVLT